MKNLKFIIIVFFVFIVFGFCSKQKTEKKIVVKEKTQEIKTEYSISYTTPYSSIDFRPYTIYFNYNHTFYDLVFNTLIESDQARNIKPEIAKKWKINEDFTQFTLELRKNIKFSNGKELNADDVIFTFKEIIKNAFTKFRELKLIKGAEDFFNGKTDNIKGIEKVNDYKIIFKLNSRFKFFIYFLSGRFSSIIPKNYGGLSPVEFSKNPIGTGPYILKEYKDTYLKHRKFQKYVFVKNKYYFSKSIKNKKFTFYIPYKPLEKDLYYLFDITISNSQNSTIKQLTKDLTIINSPYIISTILCINPKYNKQLQNNELRQIINYSINRENLVSELKNKYLYPAHSIIPKNMFGNNPYYKLNYSQLNLLLLKYKKPNITFSLHYYDKQEKIVNSLENQLKKNNILLEKQLVSFNDVFTKNPKFDAKIINFLPDYSSTYNFLIQFYINEGLANDFKISNKNILNKIKELPTLNLDKESLTYSIINKMIENESLYIPLFYSSLVYTIKGRINNLDFKFPTVINYCTLELASE